MSSNTIYNYRYARFDSSGITGQYPDPTIERAYLHVLPNWCYSPIIPDFNSIASPRWEGVIRQRQRKVEYVRHGSVRNNDAS